MNSMQKAKSGILLLLIMLAQSGCCSVMLSRKTFHPVMITTTHVAKSVMFATNASGYYASIDLGIPGQDRFVAKPFFDSEAPEWTEMIDAVTNVHAVSPSWDMFLQHRPGAGYIVCDRMAVQMVECPYQTRGVVLATATNVPARFYHESRLRTTASYTTGIVLMPVAIVADIVTLPVQVIGGAVIIVVWANSPFATYGGGH